MHIVAYCGTMCNKLLYALSKNCVRTLPLACIPTIIPQPVEITRFISTHSTLAMFDAQLGAASREVDVGARSSVPGEYLARGAVVEDEVLVQTSFRLVDVLLSLTPS